MRQSKKLVAIISVEPAIDDDDDVNWAFFHETLRNIMNRVFVTAANSRKKWDYNFYVEKVYRIDQETGDDLY